MGGEPLLGWDVVALVEFFVDRLACYLRVALSNQVLRLDIRNVTLVSRHVLSLDIVGRPTDPVGTSFRDISNGKLLSVLVLGWRFRIESSLGQATLLCRVVDV